MRDIEIDEIQAIKKYGLVFVNLWNITRYAASANYNTVPPSWRYGVKMSTGEFMPCDVGYDWVIAKGIICDMAQSFDWLFFSGMMKVGSCRGLMFQVIEKTGIKLFGFCKYEKLDGYCDKFDAKSFIEKEESSVGYGVKDIHTHDWVVLDHSTVEGTIADLDEELKGYKSNLN